MESIDFVVPTLRRPDHLRRCLDGIKSQAIPTKSVFVGTRLDDKESHDVVADYSTSLPVVAVDVEGVGVVGSMNSCIERCTSTFIALLDDDVEIPDTWLEKMLLHFAGDETVVAAGARDLLMDNPEFRKNESLLFDVGLIHWYGRVTGNHHRGKGNPRPVDILRGSNILFRAAFLKKIGFERRLAGSGAQVSWEIAIGLSAKNQKKKMIYDPTFTVTHHVAPRHDDDNIHRGGFNRRATQDIAYNEAIVFLLHARGLSKVAPLIWQFCIGSPPCPGIFRIIIELPNPSPKFFSMLLISFVGRVRAVQQWIGSDFLR